MSIRIDMDWNKEKDKVVNTEMILYTNDPANTALRLRIVGEQ